MNIFRQFQIKKEIDELSELVDLSFKRLENFYNTANFEIIKMDNYEIAQAIIKNYPSQVYEQFCKQLFKFGYESPKSFLLKQALDRLESNPYKTLEEYELANLKQYFGCKVIFEKGVWEEFVQINEDFCCSYKKLMSLLKEASIGTAGTHLQTLSIRHNALINKLNHPKFEKQK